MKSLPCISKEGTTFQTVWFNSLVQTRKKALDGQANAFSHKTTKKPTGENDGSREAVKKVRHPYACVNPFKKSPEEESKDMGNDIIPFGKYRGKPLEAMASDKQYVDWVLTQPWFRERYKELHTIIINNFQEPSETPEHNALQVLFLEHDYRVAFSEVAFPGWIESSQPGHIQSGAKFEEKAIDVRMWVTIWEDSDDDNPRLLNSRHFSIEIKPSVSDDYPSVLRQMLANSSDYLFVEAYTGAGATMDQFKKIFAASGKKVVFRNAVEAHLNPPR